MHHKLFLCILLVLMLTVAGCGAVAESQPTETPQPPEATETTEPEPTETTEPSPTETTESDTESEPKSRAALGDAVIVYERSGGIAGVSESWQIYADGRVVDADGNEWQVDPAQVEQLLADLESMGFFELDGSYMPLDTCCDRITYTLVVGRDGSAHSVTTIDDSGAPDAVWDAIDTVSTFIQDAQTAAE